MKANNTGGAIMLAWLRKSVWNVVLLLVGFFVLAVVVVGCTTGAGLLLFWPEPVEVPGPTQIVERTVIVVATQLALPSPTQPVPTQQPTALPTVLPTAVSDPVADHFARLAELDPVFRSQGLEAWLQAAGFTWTSLSADARQIEEDTRSDGAILASGIQVDVSGMDVSWPNCVSTDEPAEIQTRADSRQVQPDLRNASVVYTNVTATGTVTVYISCLNWGELYPAK